LNLIRPLVKARLSADSFGSFVLGLCFGHGEFLLLRMIKLQRVVRYLRFSYPDSGRPLARRDSHKALRSSLSCHTIDVCHRRGGLDVLEAFWFCLKTRGTASKAGASPTGFELVLLPSKEPAVTKAAAPAATRVFLRVSAMRCRHCRSTPNAAPSKPAANSR
jgi:hypothetical protein